MTTVAACAGLKREHPEWEPWLAVVEEILRETKSGVWAASVPEIAAVTANGAPRLGGVAMAIPATAVLKSLHRLLRIASQSGLPEMASLTKTIDTSLDALGLFRASLCHDVERIGQEAADRGADPGAFQAVVTLLPVPFLHACYDRWASAISEGWIHPYCPVCGSWPAFAEVRGIERSRHYRCGRCGAGWHAQGLSCPYCATSGHEDLVAFVPEKAGGASVFDACNRCRGYVKVFNRLQGCPPHEVMLEDLASVAHDVAAVDLGFTRPAGSGHPLDVTLSDQPARRRFLGWNA